MCVSICLQSSLLGTLSHAQPVSGFLTSALLSQHSSSVDRDLLGERTSAPFTCISSWFPPFPDSSAPAFFSASGSAPVPPPPQRRADGRLRPPSQRPRSPAANERSFSIFSFGRQPIFLNKNVQVYVVIETVLYSKIKGRGIFLAQPRDEFGISKLLLAHSRGQQVALSRTSTLL